MKNQISKRLLVTALFAITGTLLPGYVFANDRPQAVLDLIAGHESLAMKIRPLQSRIIVAVASKDRDDRFGATDAPPRNKVKIATDESKSDDEKRVPERLQHKERAAGADSDGVMARLSALEKSARSERERVNRPDFGVGLSERDSAVSDAVKKLAALEREIAMLEREVDALGR